MSYSQFGYSYPATSQILVSSGGHQSPCCPPAADGSPPQPVCAYDSRLLSAFPAARLATGFGLYGSSYADQISTLASGNSFYTSLPSPYDLKESRSSWSALHQSSACYPYDPSGLAASYPDRYGSMDSVARRKNATRETTNTLKAWLYEHRKNPYPTKGEKIMLAIITKMTLTQVSTWFANARRRLKKENKMTWEPRNKTSEGEDRDSSSPREGDPFDTDSSDNMPEFLKQEPTNFPTKQSFPLEEHPATTEQQHPKSPNVIAKDSFGHLACYRPHCSEDSGSVSPSPTRRDSSSSCFTSVLPTTKTSRMVKQEDEFRHDSAMFSVEVASSNPSSFSAISNSNKPKIWSLARTATSDSPPAIRRSLQAESCSDKMDECISGDVKQTHQQFCTDSGRKSSTHSDIPQTHQQSSMFCSNSVRKLDTPSNIQQTHHLSSYSSLFSTDSGLNVGTPSNMKQTHHCGEVGHKIDKDCAMKQLSSCYRDLVPDDKDLSSDGTIHNPSTPDRTRPKDIYYYNTTSSATKCENTDCVSSGEDRGSCMMGSRLPYATEFLAGTSGVDIYLYNKSKDTMLFTSKCRTIEPLSYSPESRGNFFGSERFDQTILQKGAQAVDESRTLLGQNNP